MNRHKVCSYSLCCLRKYAISSSPAQFKYVLAKEEAPNLGVPHLLTDVWFIRGDGDVAGDRSDFCQSVIYHGLLAASAFNDI